MDLDSGENPRGVRNKPGDKEQPPFPESVRKTVKNDSVETGIAEKNIKHTAARRVSFSHRLKIRF